VRLATVFVSQLVGSMLLTGNTVATRLPTPAIDRNETSSQQWFISGHLLDPALEHATNIGGMTWDAHGDLEN
jgi:hypothetical protein